VGALATAIGPTLGAALVEGPGWRWAFFINLPVAGIALLLGRQVLQEFRDGTSGPRLDAAAVVLITIAMAALSLGIVEGRDWGYTSPRILASFAVAALMVPVFLYRGLTHPSPVVDPRLFRIRSFAVANLTMALYATGFFSLILGNVLFLTSVWHYSIMRAGLAISLVPCEVAESHAKNWGLKLIPIDANGQRSTCTRPPEAWSYSSRMSPHAGKKTSSSGLPSSSCTTLRRTSFYCGWTEGCST
jgi:MFS family permease